MAKEGLGLLTFLVVCSLLCSAISVGMILNDEEIDNAEIASEISNQIVIPEIIVPEAPVVPDYSLTKSEFEDEATEAKALELANAELESRDFKEAVSDALVDYDVSVDIENYKDITEIIVKDCDVDGNKVSYDIKVYYIVDGDEDEIEKARLDEFTIRVKDLDFDDDFEDAKVRAGYLKNITVKKVYD